MCAVRTNSAVTLSLSPVCAAKCLSITLSSMYVIVRYSALSHNIRDDCDVLRYVVWDDRKPHS